jgi:isoleucyl-tRNA synthetase
MSKSLGNTMAPDEINKQYGAEILRLWVASSDTYNDLKIGKEIIQTSVDAYRKLRNTLRYMIGALDGFDYDRDKVGYADMPALERWVLHRLHEITSQHEDWVRGHDHRKIFSTLFNFCTGDLSSFYFDIRKDALYCDPLDSTRRRACRTVMHYIFERLTTWLAPIMCFTMEEVWQARNPSEDGSVHLKLFRSAPEEWADVNLDDSFQMVFHWRDQINPSLEKFRADGKLKSSLEARVKISKNFGDGIRQYFRNLGISLDDQYDDPGNPTDTLADYLIVSSVDLDWETDSQIGMLNLSSELGWTKCARSWKYFQGEGDITPRDAAAVSALDKA